MGHPARNGAPGSGFSRAAALEHDHYRLWAFDTGKYRSLWGSRVRNWLALRSVATTRWKLVGILRLRFWFANANQNPRSG
jgi:hypothetical protein